jgi:RsmE family RNA methyltransferase
LRAVDAAGLQLDFAWGSPPPSLPPLTLLVGLARPQTARKILQEATTLGVAALHFVRTERAEPQYAQSSLWSSGEWRDHLRAGAAQAFTTQLPRVTWDADLAAHVAAGSPGARRLALDNYEATAPLGAWRLGLGEPCVLAIGPERGWGPRDRDGLRAAGFALAHLGPRVLRSETAVVAALAILRADLGFA